MKVIPIVNKVFSVWRAHIISAVCMVGGMAFTHNLDEPFLWLIVAVLLFLDRILFLIMLFIQAVIGLSIIIYKNTIKALKGNG